MASLGRLLSTSCGKAVRLYSTQPASAQKTFVLTYHYVDDMLNKRAPIRAAHLEYANKRNLLLGGAFLPNVEGGLLVMKASSKEEVEDFAKNDPYVINKLVTKWEVKEWAVVVGGQRLEN